VGGGGAGAGLGLGEDAGADDAGADEPELELELELELPFVVLPMVSVGLSIVWFSTWAAAAAPVLVTPSSVHPPIRRATAQLAMERLKVSFSLNMAFY